jgi:hypothetical protein
MKTVSGEKPIEVKGQTRGASLFRMSGDRFQIKFIRIRKNFTDEILNTPY